MHVVITEHGEHMSTTPAAELARLKVRFPLWTFKRTVSGYEAYKQTGDGVDKVEASSLADLHRKMLGTEFQA